MFIEVEKTLMGGGCSKRVTAKRTGTWKRRFAAAALAAAIAVTPAPALANPVTDFLTDTGTAVMNFFGFSVPETRAAYQEDAVADDATYKQWQNYLTDEGSFSTRNIGRIWTDKTVSTEESITLTKTDGTTTDLTLERGSSDFLVMLSALSSTSNLTTTSDRPLDIVLVLDRSGSMADDLVTYTYNEAYRLNTNGQTTYYAKVGDSYVEVKRVTTGWWPQRFDHWELNGQRVEPKTSANDATEGHIQFYTRSQQSSESKMDALKAAATSFIESTAIRNEAIVDTSKQHRISIVSYSSSATINNALTAVSGQGTSSLKSTVNNLQASGGTQAGLGMQYAQTAMNNARDSAQKVVLFFTDGGPGGTTYDPFDPDVANEAIQNAKTLKDNDTLVYSVGVLDDADTSITDDEINAYMHGVSSNYPDATAYNSLGDRATDKDGKPTEYYKAASSADDLNKIFSEIAAEVSSLATGSPTHVAGDDPANGGFLTFYDELGSYMKVDAFTKIVFNDRMFENPTVTESEDESTVTYRFNDNTVSADDPSNVAHIDITVERSGDADSEAIKQGDKVTVKVPASLIPLRNFDVNTQNGTTTLKVEEQYPIRIAYGVSLKGGVDDLIKDQDEVMQSYINENTDNGNVAFYSNAYSKGAADGLTTATFDPATSNSFYTFTTDTQLYKDDQCQNKATGTLDAKNNSYWYQRSYYVQGANNTAELKTEIIELKPDTPSVLTVGDYVVTSDDGTYIKARSPRLQRVNVDTVGTKTDNATGTATNIVNPVWSTGGTAGYTEIEVHLGNNGKLTKELPGALEITKDVKVPSGFDEAVFATKEFEFTVGLKDANGNPVSGDFNAAITNAQGVTNDTVTFTNGSYACKLKDGEKIAILGLSKDTQYTVTETSVDYFDTAVVAEDGTEAATGVATGDIVANATASANFVNTYKATPARLASGPIKAQKNLTGRDWDAGEKFSFYLTALNGAPLPDGEKTDAEHGRYVELVVADGDEKAFGDIEYGTPGTYTYTIIENTPEGNRLPGMSYSDATYVVQVTVSDDHQGALKIDSAEIVKYSNDKGTVLDTPQDVDVALFTNAFDTKVITSNVTGRKDYTDNSGKNPISAGMFEFVATPIDSATADAVDAPVPDGVNSGESFFFTHAVDGTINFPLLSFSSDRDDNETYSYTVREVIDPNATNPYVQNGEKSYSKANDLEKLESGWVYQGITYDSTVWTVSIDLAVDSATGALVPSWSIVNDDPNATGTHEYVVFSNSYTPTPITLEDDTDATIYGAKTLTGRDALDTEKFEFTIEGANQETDDAIADQTVTFGDKDLATEVSGPGEIDSARFDFGSVTFTKPGTYVFNITEDRPAEANDATGYKHNGITYDTHTCQVTVTVTDENKDGTLAASVSYYGDQLFTNAYTASVDYGANAKLFVAKTLNGRDMAENEFQFTIKDSEGTVVDQTTNDASANGVQVGMEMLRNLKFDQSQVSSTPYTYVVDETEPQDDDAEKAGIQSKGVTYDQSQYKIEIVVGDNYDGTLNTTTTVTRVMDASGATVKEALGTYTTNQEIPDGLVAFVNSYQADSISTVVPQVPMNKVLTGRNLLSTDQFLFDVSKVSYNGSAMQSALDQMPNIKSPIKVTQDNAAKFNLGEVKFTHAGEYVYQVVEQNAGTTVNDIEYSGNVVEITIVVKDNTETGQLEVESAKITRGEQTFTNNFVSEFNFSYAVNFQLSKTLKGRDMEAGKFHFTVKAANEVSAEKIQLPAGTLSVNVPGAAGTDGETVTMENGADIVFKHSAKESDSGKAFVYTFSEVIPDGATANYTHEGYTYDPTVYTMAVKPVMYEATGTWKVTTVFTATEPNGTETSNTLVWNQGEKPQGVAADFQNTYAAAETVPFTPTIQKKVVGKDAAKDEFKFTLTAADDFTKDAIMNGAVKSDVLKDDVVSEEKASPAIANGDTEPISFSDIKFTKATEGENYYTFNVTEANGGTTVDGWALDGHTYIIKVKVTDENGQLVAERVDKAENDDLFTNTYGAVVTGDGVSTDGMFTKTFTGRDWTENDNFTFNITSETEGAPMPVKGGAECTQVTVNGASDTDGSQAFGFGTIKFTYDHIKDVDWGADGTRSKDFVYEVREVIPENSADRLAGVTYSTKAATLTITLKDDGKGGLTTDSKLTAVARASNNEFVNTYSSSLDFDGLNGGFDITKHLEGREVEKDQFTFTVTPQGGDSTSTKDAAELLGVNAAGTEYKSVGGGHDVRILGPSAKRELTQDDAGKTFVYEVSENADKDNNPSYDFDDTVYTVKITVNDNNDGSLTAITVVYNGATKVAEQVLTTTDQGESVAPRVTVPFSNTYTAKNSATAAIAARKELTNASLVDHHFTFRVTDALNNEVAVATSDDNGKIDFGTFTYTLADLNNDAVSGKATLGKEGVNYVYSYQYKVAEDAPTSGITAETNFFTVTVKVIDDNHGNLRTEVVYPGATPDKPVTELVFKNVYGENAEYNLDITGTKVYNKTSGLDYNAPDIANKFEFEITGVDEDGKAAPLPATTKVKNDASGNVSFGSIHYDMNVFGSDPQVGQKRVKTFTYTVTETGKVEGVENDATVKTFTVTVTDEGDSKNITAVADPVTGPKFTFTNEYSVDPVDSSLTGEGNFTITKKLDGRALAAEEFEFALYAADGSKVVSAKNDANGNVEFPAMTFNTPGSYEYTLKEVAATNVDNGITYDTSSYKVVAGVVDNGKGALEVTWAVFDGIEDVTSNTLVFTNTYEAAATSATFGAAKLLDGADLAKDQFTFELINKDGKVIATAKNDADGNIQFPSVELKYEGTYKFSVAEKNDGQEGVTYDDTVYGIDVVVTDDGKGHLVAEVKYEGDTAPVFKNTYTKPVDPTPEPKPEEPAKPTLPTTGDTAWAQTAIAALAAGTGLIAWGVKKRKRS